ncbi:cell division protein FtsL [Thiofaba sp. EF100]|jgi:cell division protein FtsL|uniref:cell division protein FtsL n=1 Tax=Thiofaba sp. EF100 TaxID=3121274 RepID=UPI0032213C0F
MKLVALLLWAGCLLSAIGVVQAEHRERKYVLAQEKAVQHRDELEIEWERLQLEEAALAAHGRVDALARERLHMGPPGRDAVSMVVR